MNPITRARLVVAGLLVVGLAQAATFNLFQPASGILKGNPSTYVTTSAAASDVISLWSGTCNASSFLRGDGSCAAAGGGTVTSIAAGTGITASPGSPITTTGTLSVNQGFSPTWTGTHVFSNDITVNGVASSDWANLTTSNTFLINTNASGQGLSFVNTSTGTAALTSLAVANSTNSLNASLSSTGYTGPYLTGGPTGQAAALWTNANVPLTLGTDDTERVRIAGDGSFINLASNVVDFTGAAGNWRVFQDASDFAVQQCDSFNSTCISKLSFSAINNNIVMGSGGDTTISAGDDLILSFNGELTLNTDPGTTGQVLTSNGAGVPPTWEPAGGSGTVTSVGLTMPSGFSVGGSPVTTSGTLAVTTTLNGNLRGNGSGFTTGAVALGSEVSGTLPVANGGTGTTTSTGTGNVVLSASPTLSGTITGGTFAGTHTGDGSGLTSLDAGDISAGTLAVARGGTGTTTSTGTGNVVLSASPTLTGTTTAATVAATTVTVGGNNVCQSTGTNCPTGGAQTAFATISVSAGVSCSINSSYDNANISSCQWLSAGAYNLELSVGAGTNPTCSVTPFNAAGYIARAGNVDANTVSAGTYFLTDGDPVTWTASDVAFTIVCFSTG